MNVKLMLGIVLFVIGIITAVIGISGVGEPTGPDVAVAANHNVTAFERTMQNVAIPAVAGISLALGGLLIGLSMGNWRHPRTHLERGDEIIDPEGYHKMKHV